jgi:hypothetical protein
MRIQQCFGSKNPDPDPIRIQGFDVQKFEKNYNWLPSKLQKKTSALKSEHHALQNMKFLNFFLFLLVIFNLLDPDPDPDADPLT